MFVSVNLLLAQEELETVEKAKVEVQIILLNLSGEECPPAKRYLSLDWVVELLFSISRISKQLNRLVDDVLYSCLVTWKKNLEKLFLHVVKKTT